MKAVTKEQCEAALGSISDAIEEYCLVVNKCSNGIHFFITKQEAIDY